MYRVTAALCALAFVVGTYIGNEYASGQYAKEKLSLEEAKQEALAKAEEDNIARLQESADIIGAAEEDAAAARARLRDVRNKITQYSNNASDSRCIDGMFVETWNSIVFAADNTTESSDGSVR